MYLSQLKINYSWYTIYLIPRFDMNPSLQTTFSFWKITTNTFFTTIELSILGWIEANLKLTATTTLLLLVNLFRLKHTMTTISVLDFENFSSLVKRKEWRDKMIKRERWWEEGKEREGRLSNGRLTFDVSWQLTTKLTCLNFIMLSVLGPLDWKDSIYTVKRIQGTISGHIVDRQCTAPHNFF